MVKRLFENKRAVFFASLLAVISLVLLASALNNTSFQPVKPLYHPETAAQIDSVSLTRAIETFLAIPFWKQVSFFVMLFMIVLLITSLLTPEARKQLLKMFINGALIVLALSYLTKKNPDLLKGLFPQLSLSNGISNTDALENIPPPVFEPPHISGTLSFLITLGIVLVAAVVIWRTYLWWKRQNEMLNTPDPLDEIAQIARASLHDLSLEGASQDTIIQCYENMNQAVFARRGLQRSYAMTAAEFAHRLENTGLPREAVERLTRLFESARYSPHVSTQKDIDEAISCLKTILIYCGGTP